MESLIWIRDKYRGVITLIERHSAKIPFSKLIVIYLKIPFLARLLITLLFFGLSHGLSYIIGFIILQSKARNEVLSLITAFQNPVDFTDRLYFYYAFVYLFITLMTIVPFGICLFYGRTLIRRLKHKKKLFILGNLFWVLLTASISFSMWQGASLLSYYLFYASKSSSFWEILIKYIFDSKELQWSTSFDLSLFQALRR